MLVIGSMKIGSTLTSGTFYCPQCQGAQAFRLRSTRPFLTLYFIPVLPIGTVSRHVECRRCRTAFEEAVLAIDPADVLEAQREALLDHVRRVMILVMIAARWGEPEKRALAAFYERCGGPELADHEIDAEAEMAERAGTDAAAYVGLVREHLGPREREEVLRGAFVVASARGDIDPRRLEVLSKLPKILGVSDGTYRAIINRLLSEEDAA